MTRRVLHVVVLVFVALLHFAFGNEECDLFYKNLTNAISATYLCFGEFDQPMAICSRCFWNVTVLELILNDSLPKNAFGVPCNFFVGQDLLLEPWTPIISPIRKIWQNAHCDQCLTEPNFTDTHSSPLRHDPDNGLPNYNLSAYNGATRRFFNQLKTLSGCISNHVLNSNASFLDKVDFPTEPSVQLNKSVCSNCRHDYTRLYEVYSSWICERVDQDCDKWLCADVVDALSRTQFVWLSVLDCSTSLVTKPPIALLPLIICTLVGAAFHAAMLCVFHQPSHVIVYMQSRVETVTDNTKRAAEELNTREIHHPTLLRKTSFAPQTRFIPYDAPNAGPSNVNDSHHLRQH
ncbi:hypothetical protein TcWFU_006131 [Taenia crassiceps]|uniref:Osteopetrosis associated transmembrane protein n=1 Tax=Taenia crassiceps TaxID=6207 RepID=A0ABR4QE74_9CEST